MNKLFPSAQAALNDVVRNGQEIAVGGFGICGIPEALIQALCESGVEHLRVISCTAGIDDHGVGKLITRRQVATLVSSYVGENKELEQQFFAGQLQLELNPQGTLAERLRAGGAGIPAFFTRTGAGTVVQEGKEVRQFNGESYVMEHAIVPDIAIIKAQVADKSGNLRFNLTARNFNPAMATAAKVCIAEVEEVVEVGEIAPDDVHLPGIYVHRLILNSAPEKRIERLTLRSDSSPN